MRSQVLRTLDQAQRWHGDCASQVTMAISSAGSGRDFDATKYSDAVSSSEVNCSGVWHAFSTASPERPQESVSFKIGRREFSSIALPMSPLLDAIPRLIQTCNAKKRHFPAYLLKRQAFIPYPIFVSFAAKRNQTASRKKPPAARAEGWDGPASEGDVEVLCQIGIHEPAEGLIQSNDKAVGIEEWQRRNVAGAGTQSTVTLFNVRCFHPSSPIRRCQSSARQPCKAATSSSS